LFFSEYVEGSLYNKALELTNRTSAGSLDLSQYAIASYTNGAVAPIDTFPLSGTLAEGASFVVCNAHIALGAHCDLRASGPGSAALNFNGDDTLVLVRSADGAQLDVIGDGTDPGTAWTANGVSTQHATLRRKCSIDVGDAITPTVFDPSIEWTAFALDSLCDLGSACGATSGCDDGATGGSGGSSGS